MRLVCPNCAAHYNVDDRVIPPGGRDVQCSNCGQTWFQTGAERPRVRPAGTPPPAAEPADAPAPAAPPAPDSALAAPAAATQPAAPAPASPAPAAAAPAPSAPAAAAPAPPSAPAGGRGLPVLEDDDDWEDDEPVDHLPPARPGGIGPAPRPPAPGGEAGAVQGRRVLDEAVLSILREEAEREARARRAETQGMEMQGELGLPAPMPAPAPVPVPVPVPGRGDTAAPAPRPADTEDWPDVAGITSTLAAPGSDAAAAPATRPRSGFRLGFWLMLLLAAAALALYLLAPQIAAAVPALADPLAAYGAAVDAARLWLERAVAGAAAGG